MINEKQLLTFNTFDISIASLVLFFITFINPTQAQVTIVSDSSRVESQSNYVQHKIDSNSSYQYDISDLFRNILHPKKERNPNKNVQELPSCQELR